MLTPYLLLSSASDYDSLMRQGYIMTNVFKTHAEYGYQAVLVVPELREILAFFVGNNT